MSHRYYCFKHGYQFTKYCCEDNTLIHFRMDLDEKEKKFGCEGDDCEKLACCYIIWSSEENIDEPRSTKEQGYDTY